ncbi:hypothetical protein U91I_02090 [alpha proteobacterium U9-1i]|nr:hypothetical protein U91I_02090 [alpha proteobacterium U9-1i]
MTRTLLAACAALALSACATAEQTTAAAPGERDCFAADSINGYTIVDDHNVNVRVGASRVYTLTLDWNARDLDWSQAIAIRAPTSFICTGNGLGVRIVGGDPVRDYYVRSISRAATPSPTAHEHQGG